MWTYSKKLKHVVNKNRANFTLTKNINQIVDSKLWFLSPDSKAQQNPCKYEGTHLG